MVSWSISERFVGGLYGLHSPSTKFSHFCDFLNMLLPFSFLNDSAEPNLPGVYASTAYHYEYIKDVVCSYPLTDQSIRLCGGAGSTTATTTTTDIVSAVGQQCAAAVGDSCEFFPCCQSPDTPLECNRVRGVQQCTAPSRPEKDNVGQSSSGGRQGGM